MIAEKCCIQWLSSRFVRRQQGGRPAPHNFFCRRSGFVGIKSRFLFPAIKRVETKVCPVQTRFSYNRGLASFSTPADIFVYFRQEGLSLVFASTAFFAAKKCSSGEQNCLRRRRLRSSSVCKDEVRERSRQTCKADGSSGQKDTSARSERHASASSASPDSFSRRQPEARQQQVWRFGTWVRFSPACVCTPPADVRRDINPGKGAINCSGTFAVVRSYW